MQQAELSMDVLGFSNKNVWAVIKDENIYRKYLINKQK